MYNESYEEYIRNILGYPSYTNNFSADNYNIRNYKTNVDRQEIEGCYPEIYNIVYPMVKKACNSNTRQITSTLIDELTNEIYSSIENNNEINVQINLNNQIKNNSNKATANTIRKQENRGEDRQFRNIGLLDLIRILIIRELLNRPGNFPGNRPPRPPFPRRARSKATYNAKK